MNLVDPLRMPPAVQSQPWYQQLLTDHAKLEEQLTKTIAEVQATASPEAVNARLRGAPAPDLPTLRMAVQVGQSKVRESKARMGLVVLEHLDELTSELQRDADEGLDEARHLLAGITPKLNAALDRLNDSLEGQRRLRALAQADVHDHAGGSLRPRDLQAVVRKDPWTIVELIQQQAQPAG